MAARALLHLAIRAISVRIPPHARMRRTVTIVYLRRLIRRPRLRFGKTAAKQPTERRRCWLYGRVRGRRTRARWHVRTRRPLHMHRLCVCSVRLVIHWPSRCAIRRPCVAIRSTCRTIRALLTILWHIGIRILCARCLGGSIRVGIPVVVLCGGCGSGYGG